jgi:hypothetical protein
LVILHHCIIYRHYMKGLVWWCWVMNYEKSLLCGLKVSKQGNVKMYIVTCYWLDIGFGLIIGFF